MFAWFFHLLASPDPDWRTRLQNFDSVFQNVSSTETAERPTPSAGTAEMDLGETPGNGSNNPNQDPQGLQDLAPPKMTAEEFQGKYSTVVASVSINLGSSVT